MGCIIAQRQGIMSWRDATCKIKGVSWTKGKEETYENDKVRNLETRQEENKTTTTFRVKQKRNRVFVQPHMSLRGGILAEEDVML